MSEREIDEGQIKRKECKICHQIKDMTDFYASNQSSCKSCRCEQGKQCRMRMKEKQLKVREMLKEQSGQKRESQEITLNHKRCTSCGQGKAINNFPFTSHKSSHRGSQCRECVRSARRQQDLIRKEQKERERIEASLAITWEERIKLKDQQHKNSYMRITYGMVPERYSELMKIQQGCCAICGKSEKVSRLVIDHSHVTGIVRGLLCDSCNLGLGFFQDDPKNLSNAIKYLDYYQSWEMDA